MSQAQATKPATQAPRASRKGKGKTEAQAPTQDAQATQDATQEAPAQDVATEPAQDAMPEQKTGPVRFMRNPLNHGLSGARLLSHTVAFIKHTTGGAVGVPMNQWRTVIGASALAYHKAKGNIAIGENGAPVLTEQGSQFFATRPGNEQALIATFEHMFATGELPANMDGERHAPVKIAK